MLNSRPNTSSTTNNFYSANTTSTGVITSVCNTRNYYDWVRKHKVPVTEIKKIILNMLRERYPRVKTEYWESDKTEEKINKFLYDVSSGYASKYL